jgi:hypothetical protein
MLSIFFFVFFSVFASVDAGGFSDKPVIFAFECIATNATFLYDDALINVVNAKFPGLNIPLGSLTWNTTMYRISEGLRPPRPDPIGEELVFLSPDGNFTIYHKIFGRHLTIPKGEIGEMISVSGNPDRPYQLLPYTAGSATLTTNEGLTTHGVLVAMFDVVRNTGIFEKFSNGYVRANAMNTIDPMNIAAGVSFRSECIYVFKFDSNRNLFWWDSYEWQWW